MNGTPGKGAAVTFDTVDVVKAVFADPQAVRMQRRKVLKWAVGVTLVALTALFFVTLLEDKDLFQYVWRYEAVGLLGASVGTAELLSRYGDAPSYALLSGPGIFYVAINAGASLAALGLILTFNWSFGATGAAVIATQILVAGFGAMALFRSSLFTVKVGDKDVGVGPSTVLSIIMESADKSTDRLLAADRAGRVTRIMRDVDYDKAKVDLPRVAKDLMQNLGSAEKAGLDAALDAVDKADLSVNAKSLLVGLRLTNVVSTEVLLAAKTSLGKAILLDPAPDDDEAVPAETGGSEPPPSPDDVVQLHSSASAGLPQTPQTPQ